MNRYGYLGVGVQGILTGIKTRTAEIEQQNKIIEQSIKSIENELDVLKSKYDAATEAANAQADAAQRAASASNAAANAARAAAAAGAAMATPTGVSAPNKAVQKVSMYHTGTDYVKKASSFLDKMLGLGPDETAAVLKVGEAVIPDYANPFAGGSSSRTMSASSPIPVTNSSNNDNSINIKIGDIVIQGDADDDTVLKLRKEKEDIIQEMFKRINKHTIFSGRKMVRASN